MYQIQQDIIKAKQNALENHLETNNINIPIKRMVEFYEMVMDYVKYMHDISEPITSFLGMKINFHHQDEIWCS